jgi:hypothetical protein
MGINVGVRESYSFLVLIIVCISYVVHGRVLAKARAAAATMDVTASCCATILVAARGPDPTDPFESRMFSIAFNNRLDSF